MALACSYHALRCTVALPQRSAASRWRRAALGTGTAAAAVARLSATVRRCLRTSPRRSPVHILSACNECPGGDVVNSGINGIRRSKEYFFFKITMIILTPMKLQRQLFGWCI